MNFIQEVLNLLDRKEDKEELNLTKDWFEFGRQKASSVGNPLYSPKMKPHAIRFDNLKCEIISGLISGTGQEYTLPMWSTVDSNNCNVQTIVDSIFSQNAQATEGKVTGNFKVTGNITLTGNPGSYSVNAIVNDIEDSINDSTTLLTVEGLKNYNTGVNVSETVTSLSINANVLTYTDENNADTDIDLSLYLDDTNLARLVSGTLDAQTGIATFTRDDSTTFTLDLSSLLDTDANDIDYVSDVALNGSNLQITGVGNAFTGNIDLSSLGSLVIGNPGSPTEDLTSISIDGVVYGIASTEADGNDFISGVELIGNELNFTGTGGAFDQAVDLSSLSGTTYTASNGIELVSGNEFGLINVVRTNSSNVANPDHTDSFTVIDDITTNTKGQVTAVNVKTVTLPDGNVGTIEGVTGTAPIVSSGGTTPAISINAATTSAAGSMSALDKIKLDGIDDVSDNYVKNNEDDFTPSAKVTQIVTLSQAQYTALSSPSASTLYIIV